jgi:hypothetical protein
MVDRGDGHPVHRPDGGLEPDKAFGVGAATRTLIPATVLLVEVVLAGCRSSRPTCARRR